MGEHYRIAAMGLGVALALGGLAACDSGSSNSSSSSATVPITPWTIPVGAPVLGATLFDGWTDLRELPGPVNVTGGWTDSLAITPDGMHLYFGYTQNDFTIFNKTFVNVATGPLRTGMTDPWFHIFRADLTSTGWVVNYHPLNTPQNGTNLFGQASASVNQAGDLLVYSQFDNTGAAALKYSTLTGSTWAPAVDLNTVSGGVPINLGCAPGGDDNGFVVGSILTSVTLSWESHRALGNSSSCGTERHLYWTTYTAGTPGTWSPVAPIPGLNQFGVSDDSQISFTPDGLTAYWTSVRAAYAIYTATYDSQSSSFINPHIVVEPTQAIGGSYTGKMVLAGEANVALLPQGQLLYLMCGIANSESTTAQGFPNDVTLKACVARK